MADYSRLSVAYTYSENSDYSAPKLKTNLDNYTSSASTHYEVQYREVGTSAETLEMGGFTAVEHVVIKNKDATNYVTCTWDSAGNGSTDNIIRIAAGKFAVIPDLTPGSDLILTANTAACDCEVIVVGT
jgi:hypothetical protein